MIKKTNVHTCLDTRYCLFRWESRGPTRISHKKWRIEAGGRKFAGHRWLSNNSSKNFPEGKYDLKKWVVENKPMNFFKNSEAGLYVCRLVAHRSHRTQTPLNPLFTQGSIGRKNSSFRKSNGTIQQMGRGRDVHLCILIFPNLFGCIFWKYVDGHTDRGILRYNLAGNNSNQLYFNFTKIAHFSISITRIFPSRSRTRL